MNEAVSGCFEHAKAATRAYGGIFHLSRAMRVRRLCLPPCGWEKACVVARASVSGLSDVGRTYAELNARWRSMYASSNSILLGHPEAMAK